MPRCKTVDEFLAASPQWQDELATLRHILLQCDLEETIKWGSPCYVHNGCNVVGIGAFKSYFGLWFHQGVLLDDRENVLVNAQEGKTRALRQWRMTAANDIKPALIRRYVTEAVRNVEAGRRIAPDRGKPVKMPRELDDALDGNPSARTRFLELTPGRRREYAEYVAEAKRERTRLDRIEKILPLIEAGVGLNDRYR